MASNSSNKKNEKKVEEEFLHIIDVDKILLETELDITAGKVVAQFGDHPHATGVTIDFNEGQEDVTAEHVLVVLLFLSRLGCIVHEMLIWQLGTVVKLALERGTFLGTILKTAVDERTALNLLKIEMTLLEYDIGE